MRHAFLPHIAALAVAAPAIIALLTMAALA